MEDGIKLVEKLSNFRMWNYCCIDCFNNELVDLDRSLRRLLDNLLVQQARDVKEILDLSRKNRDDLDELKGILLNIQQFQQKSGESSASGSNTETMPEQNEGNSKEQASLEGAALGAAFGILFDAVKGEEDKTMMFRSFLRDIKSTLISLKPLVEEMGVDSLVQHNKVLDRPKEEIDKFRMQLEMGVELVGKCSNVGLLCSFYKKFEFTNQLLALDESLRRQLNILREHVARDVRETSASISNLKMEVKQIEGSCVVQNQLKGSCEVPEPHQECLGMLELRVLIEPRRMEGY